MITKDKVTEIFCIIDEFDKNFESELKKNLLPVTDGKQHRNRKASLSDSEIMTILLLFHFGTYRNFKHYYIYYIREHMKRDFPKVVSYNRFVELKQHIFFKLVFFLKLFAFRRCTGISFVNSTMIPVCHNLKRYTNKIFKELTTNVKGTIEWCHRFKLHLLCNDGKNHNILSYRSEY